MRRTSPEKKRASGKLESIRDLAGPDGGGFLGAILPPHLTTVDKAPEISRGERLAALIHDRIELDFDRYRCGCPECGGKPTIPDMRTRELVAARWAEGHLNLVSEIFHESMAKNMARAEFERQKRPVRHGAAGVWIGVIRKLERDNQIPRLGIGKSRHG